MPGVIEEAQQTLQADKLILPLSAFGGATRDVSIALGLLPESQRVPRGQQHSSYATALEGIAMFRSHPKVLQLSNSGEFLHSEQIEYIGHKIVNLLQHTLM
jgi:hypothetical protein